MQAMSYEDWLFWCRYDDEDPWGELRADMRMASVVANILAPWCGGAGRTPDLIYPYCGEQKMTKDADEVMATVKARKLSV